MLTEDFALDLGLNYASSKSMVDELAEGMDARSLYRAYWGTFLYANVGEEWGIIQGTGYKSMKWKRVVDPTTGNYMYENNMEFGSVLPDYTGGFRVDAQFKNFDIGASLIFRKEDNFIL